MASITQFSDVKAASKRPIPDSDQAWVEGQIADAELILSQRRGDLATWVAGNSTRTALVKMVVKRMVLRLWKNPEGLLTETDGDYAYGRLKDAATGELYASARDLSDIGIKSRRSVKSFRLYLPADSPRNMKIGLY